MSKCYNSYMVNNNTSTTGQGDFDFSLKTKLSFPKNMGQGLDGYRLKMKDINFFSRNDSGYLKLQPYLKNGEVALNVFLGEEVMK